MSQFLNPIYQNMIPYTPGEQPQDRSYIKLNTNEAPYPPAPEVIAVLNEEQGKQLRLYSDPTARKLKEILAEDLMLGAENIFISNGSDEALNFAFMAFAAAGAAFADMTYGFYQVFADLYRIPVRIISLKSDLTMDWEAFAACDDTCVLANPNAPTGLALPLECIESILKANPNRLLIVDEAYIEFGGETAVPLIGQYKNLLVIRTFSKARALAGARLGYAAGNAELIQDLEMLKYATNPYNVNRLTMEMGCQAILAQDYYQEKIEELKQVRSETRNILMELGFYVPDSQANFLFAAHASHTGEELYKKLKERGILVRYFSGKRTENFIRITIGSKEEMKELTEILKQIL